MTAPQVLVADDQADVLYALRLLLTGAGCEVDLVSSVDGVVEHLACKSYDLLLLDLNYRRDTTSGREGLDLLARVHANHATLPVVVMTGWGVVDLAVEAMRSGAKSFVLKPWDDATFVEIIRRENRGRPRVETPRREAGARTRGSARDSADAPAHRRAHNRRLHVRRDVDAGW